MRRLSFKDGDEECEFCGNVEYDISEKCWIPIGATLAKNFWCAKCAMRWRGRMQGMPFAE